MTSTPMPPPFAAPTKTERTILTVILNDTNLRATDPRINILHYLNTADIPVTAEIVSRCLDLPLSTVYRTLAALEKNSLAGVTFGRASVTRWFRFQPEKPQYCNHCGQTYYSEYA